MVSKKFFSVNCCFNGIKRCFLSLHKWTLKPESVALSSFHHATQNFNAAHERGATHPQHVSQAVTCSNISLMQCSHLKWSVLQPDIKVTAAGTKSRSLQMEDYFDCAISLQIIYYSLICLIHLGFWDKKG